LSSLKRVATIESIGSSTRIEGAKLSDREIERLLSESLLPIDSKSLNSRDEQEVAGYAFVCEQIFANYLHMPFTENLITQLHFWLLQYNNKDFRLRGEYKKISIRIEAFNDMGKSIGVILETTSPLETPIMMGYLLEWTNKSLDEKIFHPLLVIGI